MNEVRVIVRERPWFPFSSPYPRNLHLCHENNDCMFFTLFNDVFKRQNLVSTAIILHTGDTLDKE